MDGQKTKKYILIGMFVLFVGYYGILWGSTKENASTENEKRELSELPSFSIEDYGSFTTDFTAFFSDHIPYRQKITEKYNNFMVNYLHVSSDEGVILGKQGWLFYNSHAKDVVTDEVIDYNGSKKYSLNQMENIANEVRNADRMCKENGAKMIFLIAPNKSSIYPQYMPLSYVQVSAENRIDELCTYLKKNTDAVIVYPKKELRKLSQEQKIYFSNDTHWNGMGGVYAASILAEEFGLVYPKIEDLKLVSQKSPEDLKLMLGINKFEQDEGNFIPDYNDLCDVELINSSENMDSYKSNNYNGKRMLMLGDSFSEALLPAM